MPTGDTHGVSYGKKWLFLTCNHEHIVSCAQKIIFIHCQCVQEKYISICVSELATAYGPDGAPAGVPEDVLTHVSEGALYRV